MHLKSFSVGEGESGGKPCWFPVPEKAPPGDFHDRKERGGKRCSGFTPDVSGSRPEFPSSCAGPHSDRDRKGAECESLAGQHSLQPSEGVGEAKGEGSELPRVTAASKGPWYGRAF